MSEIEKTGVKTNTVHRVIFAHEGCEVKVNISVQFQNLEVNNTLIWFSLRVLFLVFRHYGYENPHLSHPGDVKCSLV